VDRTRLLLLLSTNGVLSYQNLNTTAIAYRWLPFSIILKISKIVILLRKPYITLSALLPPYRFYELYALNIGLFSLTVVDSMS